MLRLTLAIRLHSHFGAAPFDHFESGRTRNMRKLMTICGILAVFSMLAMADNWSGKLLDAGCYDKHKTDESCVAKAGSDAYVLDVNGTIYRLTFGSNDMVRRAMESRADRANNPNPPDKHAPVSAKVTGTLHDGDKIKVDTIEIQ